MLILKPHGLVKIVNFLTANLANFKKESRDDWLRHAEAVAMYTQKGEDIVLEVHPMESTTGRLETLKMPRTWFREEN